MHFKNLVLITSMLSSMTLFASSEGLSKKDLSSLRNSFKLNQERSFEDEALAKNIETLNLTVNPTLINFSATNEKKMRAAMRLLEKVVNSDEFKEGVINFKYAGKNEYVQNNGKTNEQIYEHLMTGMETLKPELDNEMDISVALYKQSWGRCSVVGYTTASSPNIYVNKCFFNSYKLNEVAGNLFHEWVHKMGFSHDYKSTSRRPYSVPYALGYLVEAVGEKYNAEFAVGK